jgi:hypothetical protein
MPELLVMGAESFLYPFFRQTLVSKNTCSETVRLTK